MATGYFICQWDKTTCGGTVLEGESRMRMLTRNQALEGDRVSCGVDGKTYVILGGIAHMRRDGRCLAGTLDSHSGCPCKARLIPSYVTGIPSGVAQAIELTLTSQCHAVDDGRTVSLGNNPLADLSDINQRMVFVLRAAAQFDELLHNSHRYKIEQAIQEIAAGHGVR